MFADCRPPQLSSSRASATPPKAPPLPPPMTRVPGPPLPLLAPAPPIAKKDPAKERTPARDKPVKEKKPRAPRPRKPKPVADPSDPVRLSLCLGPSVLFLLLHAPLTLPSSVSPLPRGARRANLSFPNLPACSFLSLLLHPLTNLRSLPDNSARRYPDAEAEAAAKATHSHGSTGREDEEAAPREAHRLRAARGTERRGHIWLVIRCWRRRKRYSRSGDGGDRR